MELKLEGVTKKFGDATIVNQVSYIFKLVFTVY